MILERETARNPSILVVDDDEAFCAMVEIALLRLGYTVRATQDPRIALAWVTESPALWDVVVSDFTMPHIRGHDLVRAIKAVHPSMLCVICTGFADGVTEQILLDAGADGFLQKPFETHKLSSLISQILQNRSEKAR
jgi:DNA-binding NtrC family response regulator